MVISIPIFAIAIFIFIMQNGSFLKYSLGEGEDIPQIIEEIIQNISKDHWEEANNKTNELKKTWNKIVSRIQFSSERDEINSFTASIARLEGAILAQDKSSAFMELKEALEHWRNLGR